LATNNYQTLIPGTQNYARPNYGSGGSNVANALSAWINQIKGAGSNQQNTTVGTGTPATGTGTPSAGVAGNANTGTAAGNTHSGTVVSGGSAAAGTPAPGTQTDVNVNVSGSVVSGSGAQTNGAGNGNAAAPGASAAPSSNRISADDIRSLYTAMQTQQNNNIDYTVDQAVKQLQRAQQDAQPGFQKQHNQINIDEAQAKDAEVLYAAARGDRGGITARQYNSIMNTAAKNRTLVEQQRQQLATDTARQIEDLRAQGEFEKADAMLQIAQQQLAQLWEMQQYEDNLALNEAQLTGMYKGEQTYEAQEAERAWAYDIAMQSIKLGIVPDSNTLAAAGMNADEAKLMAYLYGQTTGTSQLINQYNPGLGAGSGLGGYGGLLGGGSYGGSGGGGGGSSSSSKNNVANVPYDPNVDYQALINDAVAKGDLVSAALYEQQRNAKIAGENRTEGMTSDYADYVNAFDPDVDYKALRDEAAKNGDMHMAAIYEAQRNAKIDYLKSTGEDVNVRKTNKYEDYLYTATNSKTGAGSDGYNPGSEDPDEPTLPLAQIAADAVKFYQTHPGVHLNSNSSALDAHIKAQGYSDAEADLFKAQFYASEIAGASGNSTASRVNANGA